MSMKPLVIPAPQDIHDWVNKSKKEMKMKSTSEFVRAILEHVKNSAEIVELKKKMEKAVVERMLKEATDKAELAAKEKERLEKRLENILA